MGSEYQSQIRLHDDVCHVRTTPVADVANLLIISLWNSMQVREGPLKHTSKGLTESLHVYFRLFWNGTR